MALIRLYPDYETKTNLHVLVVGCDPIAAVQLRRERALHTSGP